MKKNDVAIQSLITATYVVLSYITLPLSGSIFPIRLAEVMCVLPIFGKEYICGITLGCALTNFLMYGNIIDVIFGTLATLIGGIGTYYFRKKYVVSVSVPIISNTIIIPFVLKYAYGLEHTLFILFINMFLCEVITIGIIGRIFFLAFNKLLKRHYA